MIPFLTAGLYCELGITSLTYHLIFDGKESERAQIISQQKAKPLLLPPQLWQPWVPWTQCCSGSLCQGYLSSAEYQCVRKKHPQCQQRRSGHVRVCLWARRHISLRSGTCFCGTTGSDLGVQLQSNDQLPKGLSQNQSVPTQQKTDAGKKANPI